MTDLSHVKLSGRPLIISDVDDVVLEFIAPFQVFLNEQALRFVPRSFRLLGNVEDEKSRQPVDADKIKQLLNSFFEQQHIHQRPFQHTLEVFENLSETADIVFLTAMPPQYAEIRRGHLSALGLPYPLIATEEAKGPVAARIRGAHNPPVVFVDDMAHNLSSVGECLPDCLLLSLPPQSEVHRFAPRPPERAHSVTNWQEAQILIQKHFSEAY